jgi:hypothetical protein
MEKMKTLRVLRDRAGWTIDGDNRPQSFLEKERAITRAEALARALPSCELLILDEKGAVQERRVYPQLVSEPEQAHPPFPDTTCR